MEAHHRKDLSLIVHELRSPAAVVSGYLRLLLQNGAEPLSDRQRRILEETNASCGRLLRLIQEISEFARFEDSAANRDPSPVPIFALCRDVIESSAGADPTPAFACADDDRSALVLGDAARLKQAIAALVAATAREHGAEPLEGYGFVDNDGGVPRAVVALGGRGLAERRREIVGTRSTFDQWRGGTGLAVPLACRIIEAHDGRMWTFAAERGRAVSAWSLPLAPSAIARA